MQHVVVMGVSGSGKSTVAKALADELGLPFADADDLHPEANVAKMSAGVPLQDADRRPWLEAVREWLDGRERGVVACSALSRRYRDVLRSARNGAVFVHLDISREEAGRRVGGRGDHFMPASLVDSQFEALEAPADDEPHVTVSAVAPLPEILAGLRTALA